MTKEKILKVLEEEKIDFRLLLTDKGEQFSLRFGEKEKMFDFETFANEKEVYERISLPWIIANGRMDSEQIKKWLSNYENVKDKLSIRLVRKVSSSSLAVKIYDFYLEVYVQISPVSVALIKESIREWKVTAIEVFKQAEENIKYLSIVYKSTNDMLYELTGTRDKRNSGLYVLKYDRENFGGAILMNEYILHMVSKSLGGEFYILPCSVDEILVMRSEKGSGEELQRQMKDIIRNINDSAVKEDMRLSYHLFKFLPENRKLIVY